MIVLLVSLARRAYHFQQLASSSTPFHECRTYYLKSGLSNLLGDYQHSHSTILKDGKYKYWSFGANDFVD
ncbi:hypothetical protein ERW52_12130 [Aliivibrio finisterrensis]|uniref:Uncharacterized protein n=1 Tax=Aliivibrio finisterrensis TaxID=511998 RepID=A0ABY0I613_9GAMM|nr:hypothetical protein ERW53_10290 [Aliivibrio finisterrensis]RYU83930.1 hypothetical protein ERW52_12130 [Aliivibrio finisterrensis]